MQTRVLHSSKRVAAQNRAAHSSASQYWTSSSSPLLLPKMFWSSCLFTRVGSRSVASVSVDFSAFAWAGLFLSAFCSPLMVVVGGLY